MERFQVEQILGRKLKAWPRTYTEKLDLLRTLSSWVKSDGIRVGGAALEKMRADFYALSRLPDYSIVCENVGFVASLLNLFIT